MSINEMEAKCRELRQLQNLIEEAQALFLFAELVIGNEKENKR